MSAEDRLARHVSGRLAAQSSRRGFLRMAGASVLGLGLAMHGVSLASAQCSPPCGGCDAGECYSPYPACSNCTASGCPIGYTQSNWTCCTNCCTWVCAECCSGSYYCHCFILGGLNCGGCFCPQAPVRAAV